MMSENNIHTLKDRIWKEIASARLSPSHDHWHVDRVLVFARQLQEIYGGDPEVITAAGLLHDLGRQDPSLRKQASADKSVDEATQLLERLRFPPEKRGAVLTAIREHDKPELTPTTIEGRILKDADFLAGFGAWGVLRIAMWAAETREGVGQIMNRLEAGMAKRFKHLEFPESRRIAWADVQFARLFYSRLHQPIDPRAYNEQGAYIVLEGNSGSGKDTQADILVQRLSQSGVEAIKVAEPTDVFKAARKNWGEPPYDPVIESLLLMADRYKLHKDTVLPALRANKVVVSVRSFISTIVYQHNDIYGDAFLTFAHSFVRMPDMAILYDVSAEVSSQRIEKRRRQRGAHESLAALKQAREEYKRVLSESGLDYTIIDGERLPDQVAVETWQALEPILRRQESRSNN